MTETLNEKIEILGQCSSLLEGFEPEGHEKHYYIRGKFATIEAVNNNKRFYPRALWERAVAMYQDEIKHGTINTLMEWDHPKDRLEVDPSKAIAKITKLWIDGDYVMGEAVLFDVPAAATLKSMIKYGVQISVSSRASGRTDHAGVVTDFNLITFDFVARPSDKNATMYGIFENFKGNEMQNDAILESLVGMVRIKDNIIEDLKEELNFLRDKINEAQVESPHLDIKHDAYKGYVVNKDEEDAEFSFRRVGEPYTQTHRHQDHTLLKDNDPASSTYSGESEILKIARLLQQTFGRDNVVGSRLDKDLDTGKTVRGYAADVEEEVRFAEMGLDRIQKLAESESFLPSSRSPRSPRSSRMSERSSRRSGKMNEARTGITGDTGAKEITLDGETILVPDNYQFASIGSYGVKIHTKNPHIDDTRENFVANSDDRYIGEIEWDYEAMADDIGVEYEDYGEEYVAQNWVQSSRDIVIRLKPKNDLDKIMKKIGVIDRAWMTASDEEFEYL